MFIPKRKDCLSLILLLDAKKQYFSHYYLPMSEYLLELQYLFDHFCF